MPVIPEVKSLYDLAAACGVGIGEACDHASIARSTPTRWRRGTRPRPQQLSRLRAAIITLASGRGTLPKRGISSTDELILADVRTIVAAAKRIEATVKSGRGAS